MSAVADRASPALRRRWARIAVVAVVVLLGLLLLQAALRPERVTRLLLNRVGQALGLDITASGAGEYRVRGTPMLVVRDVVAREPGAATPVLRAERVLLSLPWSTIRSRGDDLVIQRIELDAPRIDVAALQHWLAARPPSETKIPVLNDGLHIVRGRIDHPDWRIENLAVTMPSLHPDHAVAARVGGRFLAAPTTIDFDLSLALSKPANGTGVGIAGPLTVEHGDWKLPARIRLSGPLRIDDGVVDVKPLRLAMSARYIAGTTNLPFAFAVKGPLHYQHSTSTYAPIGLAVRGQGAVPDFDARGALAVGRRLVVRIAGRLAAWPDTWPALPTPIARSTSPLPFALDYAGKFDLSDVVALRLQRDQTRFDGRLRMPEMLAWIDAPPEGSPLPPLSGHLSTPKMEISGAQLEGVEVTLDDGEDHAANSENAGK
ncbi:MAG: hypothetical protein ABJA62_07385 [Luteimonas sp.]